MKLTDKRVLVTFAIIGIIIILIGIRIFQNLTTNKEKAKNVTGSTAVSVAFEHPKYETIKPLLKFAGNVEPIWEAEVAAKVPGRVEKIYVKEGQFVHHGDFLAKLEQTELRGSKNAAEGTLADAQAAESDSKLNLDRYEKLYQEGAISKKLLDDMRFAYDKARARTASALGSYNTANSRLDGAILRAPHDGFVIKKLLKEGHFANAGAPLFALADISKLLVKFNVAEGQVGSIETGMKAKIIIPSYDYLNMIGEIRKIAQVADLPERTFATEVELDNSDYKIRGGLFADVLIKAKARRALIIPQSAIVMREDQRAVFLVGEDKKVVKKIISVGMIGDGIVEVRDGLTTKDLVVTSGQNKLHEGSLVAIKRDGE